MKKFKRLLLIGLLLAELEWSGSGCDNDVVISPNDVPITTQDHSSKASRDG